MLSVCEFLPNSVLWMRYSRVLQTLRMVPLQMHCSTVVGSAVVVSPIRSTLRIQCGALMASAALCTAERFLGGI